MNSDFINKVKVAVSKTTKTVAKLSGEAIDFTKLKLKVTELESALNEKYSAIGLAVYEEDEDTDIELLCDEITALKCELENVKLKLDDYRNKKECPECGKSTDKEDSFCPGCGFKF